MNTNLNVDLGEKKLNIKYLIAFSMHIQVNILYLPYRVKNSHLFMSLSKLSCCCFWRIVFQTMMPVRLNGCTKELIIPYVWVYYLMPIVDLYQLLI